MEKRGREKTSVRDTEWVAVEDRGQKANLAFTSNHSAKPFLQRRNRDMFFFA